MSATAWISKLRCPKCGSTRLKAAAKKRGNWGAWGVPGVRCLSCKESYPVQKGGVLRMIPKGDYSRYAYWEKLHSAYSVDMVLDIYKTRFNLADGFLLTYYVMARLVKTLGWKFKDSVELGCGWGSYSLSLHRFGLVKEPWLLDISSSALQGTLAVYRQFGVKAFAVQGDIHALPFRDRAFDVSLSGGLYEHFVGEEQQALVAENCRISDRVLTQVPCHSLTYWTYRGLITAKNGGKWPFGFEVPLTRKGFRRLYQAQGMALRGSEFHNLISAVVMAMSNRFAWLRKFQWRPSWFYLARYDLIMAFEHEPGRVPVQEPAGMEAPLPKPKAWKVAVLAALFAVLGAGVYQAAQTRLSLRIPLTRVGTFAVPGEAAGQVGTTLAADGDRQGSLYHLTSSLGRYRLQKFGPDLEFEKERLLPSSNGAPVYLTSHGDGTVSVLRAAGEVEKYSSQLEPVGSLALQGIRAIALAALPEGGYLVLSANRDRVVEVNAQGEIQKQLEGFEDGAQLKALATNAQGLACVLEEKNASYRVHVFDSNLRPMRTMDLKQFKPSLYTYLGMAGDWLTVNDAAGDLGLRFFDLSQGKSLGGNAETVQGELIYHLGFAAANRYTGMVMLRFAQGLGLVQTPERLTGSLEGEE